ncbi:MAG TPA: hypothetical protein PKE06_07780 [Flavilitoribacter sp.]|nr:hypothetical protein [Flavilitoribacter sp.]HMQ88307.1 hypothetical protein [Flavilitoribacter sp.]
MVRRAIIRRIEKREKGLFLLTLPPEYHPISRNAFPAMETV